MSTLRVNNLQNTSTTDGGISINNSGHVTVDGVAMPSAGPLSNRNLIINGAMQVAQRGTSDTSTAGYGCVDRFFNYHSGGTKTQSQESLTSGDPYDEGFRHFLRITRNTSGANTTDRVLIIHRIEAQNLTQSGWDYTSSDSFVTVSFWVRASVSQEYYGYLRSHDGTAQKYVFSLGTLAANTWTKVTKHIPGNSNLTIDNDNNTGIELDIAPFLGTNYTDSGVSVDAWGNWVDSTRTPDYTTTWNAADATFDMTGVQLEVGSVATPFEHRSYGDELARCQRYCYVWVKQEDGGGPPLPGLVAFWNSTATYCTIHFPVTMRANPSLTCPSRTNLLAFYTGGGTRNASTWTATQISEKAMTMNATSSGTQGDAGNGVIQVSTMAAGDFIAWSAEL